LNSPPVRGTAASGSPRFQSIRGPIRPPIILDFRFRIKLETGWCPARPIHLLWI